MSHGHIIDGIRYFLRYSSSEVVASWPRDTYIIDTDAGKIRVKDTGGSKPPLVMAPDGPCVIEHFETLISELSAQFRVVCFDMPGVGFSYPRISYDFGIEKNSKLIIAVLDELGIKKAILSFSCANSYFAIAVAKSFPDRVSRLVLAQTPSVDVMKKKWVVRNIPKPLLIPYLGQALNAIMYKKLASKWYDMSLPRNSPHKEFFKKHALSALYSGGCFCLSSIVQGMMGSSVDGLNGIEVPTTMIWGDKDWSHRHTEFESIRDHVPHCEIHKFSGCGHFPYLEQSREFAVLLKDMK